MVRGAGLPSWYLVTHPITLAMKRQVACLLVATVGAACGGGPTRQDDEATSLRVAAVFEAIGAAAASADGDCGKMATAIETAYLANEATLKSLERWIDGLETNQARLITFYDTVKPRLAAIRTQFDMIIACEHDPQIQAVQARLKAVMK